MPWTVGCHVTCVLLAICFTPGWMVRPHEMLQSEEALLRISENNQSSNIFQGKGIKEGCQEHVLDKGEHVTVAVISKCVDALQEYAQVTRNGLVGSIDAEKDCYQTSRLLHAFQCFRP
eukprot:symbB.v1.2.020291.t1/scaffold1678.1/size106249/7